jgi:ATP-dependent Clp protease ATP-binding subunit ClpB
VRAHFRPEFVNRVDEYIIFEPLRKTQIERIVRLQIDRVAGRLASRKIALKLTDAAVEHLADVGYDPVYGARPVKRAIQHGLETMLAQAILRGDFNEEDTIYVDVAPDAPPRLALSRTPPGGAAAGKNGAPRGGAAAAAPPPAQAAG